MHHLHTALWATAVLAMAFGSASATGAGSKSTLNDTGIYWCVDTSTGERIPCAGTGQDGEFGRDVTRPWPNNGPYGFHYQKVCNSGQVAGEGTCSVTAAWGSRPDDWGCTEDVHTGLIWELRTSSGLLSAQNTYTNLGNGEATDTSGLIAAVNAQGLCGANDWRLPTSAELVGQMDMGTFQGGLVDTGWFPDIRFGSSGVFWTSERYVAAVLFSLSWALDDRIGQLFGAESDDPYIHARLVRSPSPRIVDPRFVVDGHQVIDRQTRLVWRRCVEGMRWDGSTCKGKPTQFTWSDALANARHAASKTGVAWRLPNLKELESLIDGTKSSPAIDTDAFPGTPNVITWSSSASLYPIGYPASLSYTVDFAIGAIYDYSWTEQHVVRLVRDKH